MKTTMSIDLLKAAQGLTVITTKKLILTSLLLCTTFGLVACGGGSGGGSSPPPPPSVSDSGISGFAAMGKPLPVGSAVTVSCVVGSAETTTAADGSFFLSGNGLQPPCLMKATYGTGETRKTLFGLSAAMGTAHITPLTHAMLSAVSTELTALFTTPDKTKLDALVAQLPAAQTMLRRMLTDNGLGVAVAAVPGDFFTGALRPVTPTVSGDAMDLLLDAAIVRFGQAESLGFSFSSLYRDYGIGARVDWSRCDTAPRAHSEGGYYAEGCNGYAVVLDQDPSLYASNPLSSRYAGLNGSIKMGGVSGTFPQGSCALWMSASLNQGFDERYPKPTWVNGPAYGLTNWDTYLSDPTDTFRLNLRSAGNISNMFKATVFASSPYSGAPVLSVWADTIGAGLLFDAEGYLRKVVLVRTTNNAIALAPSNTCNWY